MPPGVSSERRPVERLGGEQVVLQAQRRLAGDDGRGVGQGEQHQVVAARRALHEGAPVVDVHRHARVGVGTVRMPVAADLHQGRVDLDRVDLLRALAQRDRDVVAGARADDEHAVVRPGIRVGVEVERRVLGDLLDRGGGLQRGVVDVDAHVAARRPVGADLVVRRPLVGAQERLQPQHHHGDRDAGRGQPAPRPHPRPEQHDEHHGREHRPGERRHPQERQPGEGDDAEQRAADVEAVGVERLEEREGAGHLLRDGAQGGDGEQEDHREREPARQRRHAEVADQGPATRGGRAGAHREGEHERDEQRQQGRGHREDVAARVPRRNPRPMPRKLASSTKLVRCTR